MALKSGLERTHQERERMKHFLMTFLPRLATIAKESDPKVRLRAIQLVGEIKNLDARHNKTRGYRTQINYPYWKALAIAEQEERTVRARRLVYEAEAANEKAELDKAISLYEEAFAIWAEIFDDYPILTIDDTAEDLFKSIRRYMIAIDSEEIAADFPLKTFVEIMGEYGQVDSSQYVMVRSQTQAKLKARQAELADEEKRLEQEAAEAEKAKSMKKEDGTPSKAESSSKDQADDGESESKE